MTVYNQRPKNIKLGSDKISSVNDTRSVKFKKSDKLSRKEIKKLKPGESYITKNDKLAWRRSSKEIWRDNFSMILRGIIFPFYHVYKFLNKRCYDFFYPRTNAKWNGIIGPGGSYKL